MSLSKRTVLVKNVSSQGTVEELTQAFEEAGALQYVLSPASGIYYMIYSEEEAANTAVTTLHGGQFKTRKLEVLAVEEAREQQLASLLALDQKTVIDPVEQLKTELSLLSANQLGQVVSSLKATKVGDEADDEEILGAVGGAQKISTAGDKSWNLPSIKDMFSSGPKTTVGSYVPTFGLQTPPGLLSSGASTQYAPQSWFTSGTVPIMSSGMPLPSNSMGVLQPGAVVTQLPGSGSSNIRLSQFSGDSASKNEISYPQYGDWKLEGWCERGTRMNR